MCEQCSAETIELFEFAPHWTLQRAQQAGNYAKSGQLCLVTYNDPDFYLSAEPIIAPRFKNGKLNYESPDFDKFWDVSEIITKDLRKDCNPEVGYNIISCCQRVGFGKKPESEKTLRYFGSWLTDRLGRLMLLRNKGTL